MNALLAELRRRLLALLPAKLALTVLINVVFWGGYGWLGRHALRPVRTVPLTALDRAIPYAPDPWAWIYLSQFLLTALLPWLIDSRAVLRRYVLALGVLTGASFVVFLLWPVASPRPPSSATTGAMRWIATWDGTYNAFPSLHAGFLVLMAGLGWREFARTPSASVRVLFALWAVAILGSTLATRQHFVWDLIAGLALGLGADRFAWRGFSRNAPAPRPPRGRVEP